VGRRRWGLVVRLGTAGRRGFAGHDALELGVNWIDTAAVYGLGHSEELVGRLIRELPPGERPLTFTKCGLRGEALQMRSASRLEAPGPGAGLVG